MRESTKSLQTISNILSTLPNENPCDLFDSDSEMDLSKQEVAQPKLEEEGEDIG